MSVFAVGPMFVLVVGSSFGQEMSVDSSRTAWLRSRMVSLDDMMNGGSLPRDVARALESARVVAFGEATHGDGTGFDVRNVLTRQLHESLGFDLLALEATGFHQADGIVEADVPASAVVDSMESWLWRSSVQAREGLIYAAETRASERPLRIRGIDVQHGRADGKSLFDEVEAVLDSEDLIDSDWSAIRRVLDQTLRTPFAPVPDSVSEFVSRRARELAEELRPVDSHAAILLETALANALVPWTRDMNPRDRQMGKLLVHMSRSERPGERVILWAASSHAIRNLPAIDSMDPSWSYDASLSLGDVVSDSLGHDYYVVAITACHGTYGASAISLSESNIDPARDGSLEAMACSAPFETAAFLDVRGSSDSPGGAWLHSPLQARPLGYSFKRASWPLVLDALIVVREMQPSIPYSP